MKRMHCMSFPIPDRQMNPDKIKSIFMLPELKMMHLGEEMH